MSHNMIFLEYNNKNKDLFLIKSVTIWAWLHILCYQ